MRFPFLILGLPVLFAGACETETVQRVGDACLVNSDCSSPLVCVFETCHIQCRKDADCRAAIDEESLCQRGEQPVNVCQNESERHCTTEASCAPTQVCAVDQRCRDQCDGDRDCTEGQVCAQGACASADELVDGRLAGAPGGAVIGNSCRYHSDCPERAVCAGGICRVECLTGLDCDVDECCTLGNRCALQAFRDRQCQALPPGADSGGATSGGGAGSGEGGDHSEGGTASGGGGSTGGMGGSGVGGEGGVGGASPGGQGGSGATAPGGSSQGGTGVVCPDALLCGSSCVHPSMDPNHCGGCNRVCGGSTACVHGTCLTQIAEISANSSQASCAVLETGEVTCFGYQRFNLLGTEVPEWHAAIRRISLSGPASDVALALHAGCALLANGSVECWGVNHANYLGRANLELSALSPTPAPAELPSGSKALRMDGGVGHVCAALDDGSVACWGDNTYGQLGHESSGVARLPNWWTPVAALAMGLRHSCLRVDDETADVLCWGSNQSGALGGSEFPGPVLGLMAPDPELDLDLAHSLVSGQDFSCAISGAGEVKCWGSNQDGVLGVFPGDLSSSSEPQTIPLDPAIWLAAGSRHVCAVTQTQELWCWGLHGVPSANQMHSPLRIGVPGGVSRVFAGDQRTFVMQSQGATLSFGRESNTAYYGGWTLGRSELEMGNQPHRCCENL